MGARKRSRWASLQLTSSDPFAASSTASSKGRLEEPGHEARADASKTKSAGGSDKKSKKSKS